MQKLSDYVLSNGNLNENLIVKKEVLYKGFNGRCVERFYVSQNESYVFKPMTHDNQWGKEIWVYENVLSSLPPVYPKMVAKSPAEADVCWSIYEDLGPLHHDFKEGLALEVAKLMAAWHRHPTERLMFTSLKGQKPFIEQMSAELQYKRNEVNQLLQQIRLEQDSITRFYCLLDEATFTYPVVLSHGDLHQGNYAVSYDRVVILDWEHLHLNSPFWDLYHLIDLRHPLYSKYVTPQGRTNILNCYLDEIEREGVIVNRQQFIKDYCFFSSVFSIWMLLLINKDLAGNDDKWPKDRLQQQFIETAFSVQQCIVNI